MTFIEKSHCLSNNRESIWCIIHYPQWVSIKIAVSPHFILSMQSKSDKITKVSLIRLQDKVEDSENSKTSQSFIT